MANIVFDYSKMKTAVANIQAIANKYEVAASTFQTDFETAVKDWTGESKDKTNTFVTKAVKEFQQDQIPALLKGLAEMLAANIQTMGDADTQIAGEIPTTLGQ